MSGRRRVHLTALAHAALLFSVATLVARALPLSNVIALVVAVGSIRTVYIRGSDHRALLPTVEVPLDPTAS